MRNLTIDEKINIKAALATKGLTLPRLDMRSALMFLHAAFGPRFLHAGLHLFKPLRWTSPPVTPRP